MFLSKKHLDRRTFLRGMGATVALPLLDAMVPARALLASIRPVPRLAFVYFPHGAVMDEWLPADAGRSGQLGRILEPLSPFANRLTIVSGVENRHAYGPVHAITPGTWLSGTSPRESGDGTHGATIDQLAADYLGRETALPSLALAAEEPVKIGAGVWEGQYDDKPGDDDLVPPGRRASTDAIQSACGVRPAVRSRRDRLAPATRTQRARRAFWTWSLPMRPGCERGLGQPIAPCSATTWRPCATPSVASSTSSHARAWPGNPLQKSNSGSSNA